MSHRLFLQELSDGRVSVLLQREDQIFAERAGSPVVFVSPLDTKTCEDLRWYLEDYLEAPFAVYEERGQAIQARLKSWGEALFRAVLSPGTLGNTAYIQAQEGSGLSELALIANSPSFLRLPWELLKDPQRAKPLALALTAFDRTLNLQVKAADQHQSGKELRVLMVIARPNKDQDVSYQMIARPLLRRLEEVSGNVQLDVLRPPTLKAFEAKLAEAKDEDRPYQIVHFDGHGDFGTLASVSSIAQGYVVFERERGGKDQVLAEQFAPIVNQAQVPLVVLNACRSGTLGLAAAEAAVATRLLEGGVASVVAMAYKVYTVAAAEFMAAFYEALFAGKTVSEAVSTGRQWLFSHQKRPSLKGRLPLDDWIVPVHYTSRLLSFPGLQKEKKRSAPSLKVDQFIGRDGAVYELELALRRGRVMLLHGLGGTGKTELAKAFGRWWRDTGGLEDPVWIFFHAFEPGVASFSLNDAITAVGMQLFGPDFMGKTAEERRELILRKLRQHRMLLIWDNFESVYSMPDPGGATQPLSPEQRTEIAAFLAAFRSEDFGSALLVTSRTDERWLDDVCDVCRVALGGLSPQEAAQYADDVLAPYPQAQQHRQDKAFGELMEWLNGHPLSLKLILPHLEKSSAATLLAGLRGMDELPEEFAAAAGRLQSLGASVKYSLDHLPEDVCRLLPMLSLFEGAVDEDVLAMSSHAAEVPTRFANMSKQTWQAALTETARVGLLTPLGDGQYILHPALPSYLAAQWHREAGQGFEKERQAARRALLTAYTFFGLSLDQQIETGLAEKALALLEPQRRPMGQLLPILQPLNEFWDARGLAKEAKGRSDPATESYKKALELESYKKALALLERQRRTMEQLLGFALTEGRFAHAQAILQPLDVLWGARGLAKEAKGWVDRVRQAVEGIGGAAPDFDSEAGSLWLFAVGTEANWAIASGDLARANKVYDDLCRTLEMALPGESRDRYLATVYHNYGMVVQGRGDLATAEAWYKKALTIRKALNDRPMLATDYNQLGMVAHQQGNLAGAEVWYKKALAIFEDFGNRPNTASSYANLATVAQEQGDLAAAQELYVRALRIFEALGDRLGMAKIYHQLGNNAYLRVAEIAASVRNVAELMPGLSRAEMWYREALKIREARDDDRPMLATDYYQLGMVAQLRGDLADAEAWYQKSLTINEFLGNDWGMADSYHQLGMVAYLRGDLAAAEAWGQKSLTIKEALGNDLGMAQTYAQLGLVAEKRGDQQQALDWTVRSVTLFAKFPHHRAAATSTAPRQMTRLTVVLGLAALQESWQRCTGRPLPAHVRAAFERMLGKTGSSES